MYTKLKQTLSFYDIVWELPYFVSSGNSFSKFPEKSLRMDFYVFGMCTQGEIRVEIDNKEYTIEANTFLFSAPSTAVHFKKVSADFKMDLLLFEKNFILKNLSNPFIIEKTILFQKTTYSVIQESPETIADLQQLLKYLELKAGQTGKFTDEIMRSLIINLLLETAEISYRHIPVSMDTDKTNSDVYFRFRKLILENILENKSVQFYADQLNVSNKYLIEIVKRASGKTPHEIIDDLLLKEAYVLLGNTELTIAEIAYRLQFNSTSAFGRFFKKYASTSPSSYRINENLHS